MRLFVNRTMVDSLLAQWIQISRDLDDMSSLLNRLIASGLPESEALWVQKRSLEKMNKQMQDGQRILKEGIEKFDSLQSRRISEGRRIMDNWQNDARQLRALGCRFAAGMDERMRLCWEKDARFEGEINALAAKTTIVEALYFPCKGIRILEDE